jgi:hypothetical protein
VDGVNFAMPRHRTYERVRAVKDREQRPVIATKFIDHDGMNGRWKKLESMGLDHLDISVS